MTRNTERDSPLLQALAERFTRFDGHGAIARWLVERAPRAAVLLILQYLAYSYFYFILIFTNHTLPNVLLYPYPSFKSRGEGRWIADLIIQMQGGSGVQSFQMLAATFVQAINGLLWAEFLGIEGKVASTMVAALLCVYPAFLDYYSFAIDHFTFVIGDTLAILGALSILRGTRIHHFGRAAVFYFLCIGCYQPKIALVGLGAVLALVLRWEKCAVASPTSDPWCREVLRDLLKMLVAVGGALVSYALIAKLMMHGVDVASQRIHTNSLSEFGAELALVYPKFYRYFARGEIGLPSALRVLPALAVIAGTASFVMYIAKRSFGRALAGLGGLLAVPIAIDAAFLANDESWASAGRIVSAHGYCFVAFVALGLRSHGLWLRRFAATTAGLALYYFFVLATQASNAAVLKQTYELAAIGRLVNRMEDRLSLSDENPRPLIMSGQLPGFDYRRYIKYFPADCSAHVFTPTLIEYRDVEILNYFFGRVRFRRPTKMERDKALQAMADKAQWPASSAVFENEGSAIVILEKPGPRVPLTWTQ